MSKTHSQSGKQITLSLAVWIGLVFVLCIVCFFLIPLPSAKKLPSKTSVTAPTRAFIDTQKIDKVYNILVPN